MAKGKRLSIRVTQQEWDRLQTYAANRDISMAEAVRYFINTLTIRHAEEARPLGSYVLGGIDSLPESSKAGVARLAEESELYLENLAITERNLPFPGG